MSRNTFLATNNTFFKSVNVFLIAILKLYISRLCLLGLGWLICESILYNYA